MQGVEPRDNGVAWRPTEAHRQRSRLLRLVRQSGSASLAVFRERAAADPAWFWQITTDELGVVWSRAPRQVLDPSRGKPWATWFPDGRMNYTASAIDRWAAAAGT